MIAQEPGRRVGAFSFGSRVLIDYDDLRASELLAFGSRASYQILLRVRESEVERLTREIRRDFRDRFVQARSYRSTEDDIGEDLLRAENYLSLVGFIMVVLGGIGVWSVTRVFVKQKIKSVAILKCVGATGGQILATYVAQVVLLGLCGSLLGVAIAAVAIAAIPESAAAAFGNVSYGLTLSAALQGVAVGLLVSLLFSLVPLLEVRRVKPLLLLRSLDIQGAPAGLATAKRRFPAFLVPAWVSRADAVQIGAAIFVSAALVAVAAWQAASLRVALVVCGGFAGISLILHGAGALLVRVVRPLAAAPYFPLRHAVVSLRRPGNQTRVILLAVGLGTFFVLGVKALQANLLSQFSVQLQRGGADMFLIDIQHDQVDGVRDFFKAAGIAEPRLIPVLRARVTGVRGREVNLDSYADVRGRGGLGREYVITYRDRLEPNETLLEGKFWSGQPALPDDCQGAGSLDREEHPRPLARPGRRSDAVRCPRPGDRSAGDERSRGRVGRRPERRVHVRVPPGPARPRSAHLHRHPARARGSCGAGPFPAGPGREVSERLRDRRAGSPRIDPGRRGQRHVRDLNRRRPSLSRAAR